jgi:hypothetical protein
MELLRPNKPLMADSMETSHHSRKINDIIPLALQSSSSSIRQPTALNRSTSFRNHSRAKVNRKHLW